MFALLQSAKNTNGTQTETNKTAAKKPARKYLLTFILLLLQIKHILQLHNREIPYLLRRQISHFIFKQTNKCSIFLLQKQTFFNCEKYLQANILNTHQVLRANIHPLPFHSSQTHKPKREKVGVCGKYAVSKNGSLVFKNKGGLHPFTRFLFLLSLSPANGKHYIHTYIYICVIYMCDVRYTDKHSVFFVRSFVFALFLRFMALCGFLFAFTAFLCLFLFLHQPTHPTPISRHRIGGYPIP